MSRKIYSEVLRRDRQEGWEEYLTKCDRTSVEAIRDARERMCWREGGGLNGGLRGRCERRTARGPGPKVGIPYRAYLEGTEDEDEDEEDSGLAVGGGGVAGAGIGVFCFLGSGGDSMNRGRGGGRGRGRLPS
jgi:hypothetical protein